MFSVLVSEQLYLKHLHSTYTSYSILHISHTVIACTPLSFLLFLAHNKNNNKKRNKGKSNANNFHPHVFTRNCTWNTEKVAQIFVQAEWGKGEEREMGDSEWLRGYAFPPSYMLYLNDLSIVACASGIYIAWARSLSCLWMCKRIMGTNTTRIPCYHRQPKPQSSPQYVVCSTPCLLSDIGIIYICMHMFAYSHFLSNISGCHVARSSASPLSLSLSSVIFHFMLHMDIPG